MAEKRLSHAALAKLSHLSSAQLDTFMSSWPAYPTAERRRALKSLIELAEDGVELDFNDLFRRLLTDSDPEVRALAVEGLWEDDRLSTAVALLDVVDRDPADVVKTAAVDGLGRFALRAALGELRGPFAERLRGVLLQLTRAGTPREVRCRAIEACGYLTEEPFRQAIRSAYADVDVRLQASAIKAMGRSCDEVWFDTIIRELHSEEPLLRFEAARATGEMEDERAVPPLLDVLDDDDVEVRLAAIQALGAIGGQRSRQALHRIRLGNDTAMAEAADAALDQADNVTDPLGIRIREINPN